MTTPTHPDEANPTAGLFADLPPPSASELEQALAQAAERRRQGAPRVLEPNRAQIELRASDLESLLAEEHRARLVWGYVERQDLSALYDAIKARGAAPGRCAIDPRILFALWLYATLDGVGSGREVARLSREHDAYRWICGGVAVNYHALNDFRTAHDKLLDELLSDNVAALAAVGAITLERVAQDGMRVRADAGAASFRRQGRLEEHLVAARELVRSLKAQVEADPTEAKRRAQAAKLRAAREREACIQAALDRLPEVAATKRRNGGKSEDARASTTDADASVMKMGDGGFRPAYNVQFATDCAGQVIVGLDVVTAGSDMAQLAPMVDQVEQRVGKVPAQWLVDGGFPAHEQIDAVAGKTELYAPVPKSKPPKSKDQPKDPPDGNASGAGPEAPPVVSEFAPKPGDSEAVAQWRGRMNTDLARAIYKDRAATAECVNAQARNRGLLRMPVRGLAKVKCVVRLYALAHNLLRTAALAPQLIGWGQLRPA
jgi:transposase